MKQACLDFETAALIIKVPVDVLNVFIKSLK